MENNMKELPGPYEIFELEDKETLSFRIEKWEIGKMKITPKGATESKEIEALRIVVPQESKKEGVPWWDITSKTLIAQMMPHLEAGNFQGKTFTVTKYGIAPWARFSLVVSG